MTGVKIKKQKVQICKNCLEATELMNKINYLKKNKITMDGIKENCKEFIKNNKSVLQIQKRFKSERHNVFTEEINKIALISSKDLEYDIKEIKFNNIKKRYKK